MPKPELDLSGQSSAAELMAKLEAVLQDGSAEQQNKVLKKLKKLTDKALKEMSGNMN